jgi:hypothetical protein
MKTEVIMKRELFGREISQKSNSEMFSATDLVKAGNVWRISNGMEPFNMQQWLTNKSTKEFIAELEQEYGKNNVKQTARGRGKHTWVHPLLFIDMALSISPRLKIEVYKWLYDELLKYRRSSGNSYKKMTGALYVRLPRKTSFSKYISYVAEKIKSACKVSDWQKASEQQLQLRDSIHHNIYLLADVLKSADEAVRIGINKAIEDSKE